MNKEQHIHPQGLQVPTDLEFKTASNGLFECNGKLVQIVPSLPVEPEDNPPADLVIHGIGKYSFNLIDTNAVIFSFVNIQAKKIDCAILEMEEFVSRLKPCHYSEDKINLKLVLSERGLHECLDYGAEGFFMALWISEKRNLTEYLNNWSVFY